MPAGLGGQPGVQAHAPPTGRAVRRASTAFAPSRVAGSAYGSCTSTWASKARRIRATRGRSRRSRPARPWCRQLATDRRRARTGRCATRRPAPPACGPGSGAARPASARWCARRRRPRCGPGWSAPRCPRAAAASRLTLTGPPRADDQQPQRVGGGQHPRGERRHLGDRDLHPGQRGDQLVLVAGRLVDLARPGRTGVCGQGSVSVRMVDGSPSRSRSASIDQVRGDEVVAGDQDPRSRCVSSRASRPPGRVRGHRRAGSGRSRRRSGPRRGRARR